MAQKKIEAREWRGCPHHSCFGAIRRSAAIGCGLCKLIMDKADSWASSDEPRDREDEENIITF
jgi:hypothetical protein